MKKGLITLVTGIFIGATATLAIPAYAAVKQYILTQVNYPIIVNGVEYKDPDRPILNYEGSTYIPLAKIGDLTGVNYQWNDTLKRVEIGSIPAREPDKNESAAEGNKNGCDIAGQKGATLCPDTVIEWPEEPGYKGYPDSEDPSYQMAIAMGRAADDYPPLMSEGWISEAMLREIEYITVAVNNEEQIIYFTKWSTSGITSLMDLKVSTDVISAQTGDFVEGSIRIKKYYGNFFYSISDLQKAGIF
ncbi:hypothetical protein [Paenibacillus naphthalenovorans]|uniref:hypothetical protein n=1 Tax=Paenibacillus naphthalenovorans TaxID=162209 RepID=UPI000886BC74|nr:hypothetical protein [Paenibacillus naphthalenovorans]SDJ92756.1 hypothetical protein SAMN05421868_1592 [Paenibacillus naphthalenovorans]